VTEKDKGMYRRPMDEGRQKGQQTREWTSGDRSEWGTHQNGKQTRREEKKTKKAPSKRMRKSR
jgi:hypothetical protein